jgi:uroporphyrinogen decarboxylase
MSTMTHRERVLAALDHKPTDAVPFDIGGTKVTSLNVHAYDNLRSYLGFQSPTRIAHYRSQRTHMAEEVSRFFDADTRRISVPYPYPLPEATTARVQCDEWGNEWTQAETGLYFVSRSPLAKATTIAEVNRHPWPDPSDLMPAAAVAAAAKKLREETDCAVTLDLPDGVTHLSQFLRGFDTWLLDCAENHELLGAVLDNIADIYVAMVGPLFDAIGDNVDVVLHCDDIAMQTGPMINPRTYRKLIKPRQKRIFDAIKSHTKAKLIYHTCGSVAWALPDIIEMGADAVNPVQVSASHMDTADLKREFGKDITFWGAIDTHHALPFGNREDVLAEVKHRIDDLAGDGGYVLGSVHIVQSEVPPQNLLAMAEGVHRYGGRSDGTLFQQKAVVG